MRKQPPFAAAAAAASVAVGMALAAPSPAAAAGDARVQVVPYRDLDLTREAGIRTLERRVHGAIRKVCRDTARLAVADLDAQRMCLDAAGADARSQIERAVRLAQIERGLSTAQR